MKKIESVALIILSSLLLTPILVHAESSPNMIKYAKLYADSTGITHFKDEQISFGEPNADGARFTPLTLATQVGHLLLPVNFKADWHPAPRKQWIFVLTGTVEVEAQDGEIRQLSSGSIAFVEDTIGKGHQTRNVGDEPVLIAWVPVD